MVKTCRNGYETCVRLRHIELAIVEIPPGDQGAVRLQGEAVLFARRNRHKTRVGRRDVTLPTLIAAPALNRAVSPQRQIVTWARRNLYEPGIGRRNVEKVADDASPDND